MFNNCNIKYFLFIIFIVFLSRNIFSKEIKEAGIIGRIRNLQEKSIRIGSNSVPISEIGEFEFFLDINKPTIYEITYSGVSWAVYIEPNKNLEISLTGNEISKVEYKGELAPPNDFLKKAETINKESNDYFNGNWVKLHTFRENKYISVMDSLKNSFLAPLGLFMQETNSNYKYFHELFEADLNYGFNRLIVHYPEQHLAFTGEHVSLSTQVIEQLNSTEIDNPGYFDLPNYKRFAKSWIDYKADILSEEYRTPKHYNLKKMDAVFRILPEIFYNQMLKDFWLSEYLYEHADQNGMANSQIYFEKFNSICKTDIFRTKINDFIKSESMNRNSRDVRKYKTVNEFNLEAHIFYPEDLKEGEKRPAIVIFHGGGWNSGKPDWGFGRAKHFAEKGMVAVCAQYRLTNAKDITLIESMADAMDIIRWMRSNSDSFHIMPDSIAAYGWSAGAHLASCAAIFNDSLSDKDISPAPNALILVSPAVSLSENNKGWVYNVLASRASVSSVNPVEHVRAGLPPTIILQGRDDTVTPLEGVKLFNDKMNANNNYCELCIYDDVGHLFTPNTMRDDGWPQPDKKVQEAAYKKADEFLFKHGFIKRYE